MGFDADDGDSSTRVVAFVIEQARFDDARNAGADGGFASTVWDSAIVLAKFVEKHQEMFRGLRVCELGAGCGLVSVAMLHAGASRVVATDLAPNTPLLFSNVSRNAPLGAEVGKAWDVKALTWGADAAEALGDEPFDLVVATDCMYVPESATALADTLEALVFGSAKRKPKENGNGNGNGASRAPFGAPALFSYGRNRQAESAFEAACASKSREVRFVPSDVPEEELDELYQCSDVRVVRYRAEASD
jgi:predicted nicotinamide N-methyase